MTVFFAAIAAVTMTSGATLKWLGSRDRLVLHACGHPHPRMGGEGAFLALAGFVALAAMAKTQTA